MSVPTTKLALVDQIASSDRTILFPVSGAGSDIAPGTILMPGATQGTNIGTAIPITAASNAHALGILGELHDYSVVGDAVPANSGHWYPGFGSSDVPSHPVNLADTCALIRVDYSLVSTLAVASATATALTITGLQNNVDSCFMYVNAGTGIGQLGFCKTATAGVATLISALTATLDNTSKLTQVLPLFHDVVTWLVGTTTAPALLDSAAAAGTGRFAILENFIVKNGEQSRLDPKAFHNAQGLNSLSSLTLFSRGALQDVIYHPVA